MEQQPGEVTGHLGHEALHEGNGYEGMLDRRMPGYTHTALPEPGGALTAAGSSSMLNEQALGILLAVSSSIFIGTSFIIKKRGLRIAGSTTGALRAGSGGFSYLKEPTWWAGMLLMIVGEAANFAAYAFAPAILVTPLGALSIIVSAILAHTMLKERLNVFGIVGCGLCITGALTIILHAPEEKAAVSVVEVWQLAKQPPFMVYATFAIGMVVYLIWYVAPLHGTTSIFVYIAICSLAGSLSVMSCKALGIALKLTWQGDNQLLHIETYFSLMVVVCCVLTQMNYLNKALDLFNTAIVSPVYYVMFTLLTIVASLILFRDYQDWRQILTEVCGFVTIVGGTFLLHTTRDIDVDAKDLMRLAVKSGSSAVSLNSGAASSLGLSSLHSSSRDKDKASQGRYSSIGASQNV
mmetsp:Transcript_3003/g.7847  ORF Transcript_3003/g.7847 Transcript_3003/m.7847 type:complete len:408 (+) Transcript_3003:192-1415(+)|eukprot:CAMPEP_0202414658 /NCGR_PEP_ID=MMETSP1128-20130828/33458_1 /ASSEMBLY_ACC=CAM_ASM_000463 /TAXON_ID=3047 /ORGANISM="Dunaliella tertiolecta, Strain CCMP1320" /LENGTH=407 /DNA_ID=CAMNT_0049021131 /DNA_START=119 /DNA_END=1342 /DNA_ORIENTATION=-